MDGGFLAVPMELHADFNDTCRVYYKTNWIKPCFMYVYIYRTAVECLQSCKYATAVGKIWDKEEKIAMANVVG